MSSENAKLWNAWEDRECTTDEYMAHIGRQNLRIAELEDRVEELKGRLMCVTGAQKVREGRELPPPWSEAPDWATHRVQNPDGWWVWCGHRGEAYPEKSRSGRGWLMRAKPRFKKAKKCAPNPDWESTRQERPCT